ncbi:hypothetical protein NDU88_000744 [Pleurodeles waltl]|uniref:Uncharacterized protein n=1 Tax=Pleurodeles waltl TaxID=8319 RepID=A0AAV7URC6_PLEWA|nr:hypothetical protein NDU88_000744 [Pleurodeles waltl]
MEPGGTPMKHWHQPCLHSGLNKSPMPGHSPSPGTGGGKGSGPLRLPPGDPNDAARAGFGCCGRPGARFLLRGLAPAVSRARRLLRCRGEERRCGCSRSGGERTGVPGGPGGLIGGRFGPRLPPPFLSLWAPGVCGGWGRRPPGPFPPLDRRVRSGFPIPGPPTGASGARSITGALRAC